MHFIFLSKMFQAAEKGLDSLKEAVRIENLLIGNDKECTSTSLCETHVEVDQITMSIIDKYHCVSGKPITTTADGDCLFNATSILLFGNESKSVEMRYKTVLKMVGE
jgi:hypothetical protein